MKRLTLLVLLLSFTFFACQQSSQPDWTSYIGTWQSADDYKVTIKIAQAVREGQLIDERYDVSILNGSPEKTLPDHYLTEGYYYFKIGPNQKSKNELKKINETTQEGLPNFVIHPFDVFMIHTKTIQNPDTTAPKHLKNVSLFTYIGQIDENTIRRIVKGQPDVDFIKIEDAD
ncbi:MAG: hypothetical protein AAF502_06895 [Bacteroidota bacterium]